MSVHILPDYLIFINIYRVSIFNCSENPISLAKHFCLFYLRYPLIPVGDFDLHSDIQHGNETFSFFFSPLLIPYVKMIILTTSNPSDEPAITYNVQIFMIMSAFSLHKYLCRVVARGCTARGSLTRLSKLPVRTASPKIKALDGLVTLSSITISCVPPGAISNHPGRTATATPSGGRAEQTYLSPRSSHCAGRTRTLPRRDGDGHAICRSCGMSKCIVRGA